MIISYIPALHMKYAFFKIWINLRNVASAFLDIQISKIFVRQSPPLKTPMSYRFVIVIFSAGGTPNTVMTVSIRLKISGSSSKIFTKGLISPFTRVRSISTVNLYTISLCLLWTSSCLV